MDVMSAYRPIRVAVVTVVVILALLEPSARAEAHGGRRVLRTTVGPYHIEATISGSDELVDETILLEDASGGRPVVGATVAITLAEEAGRTVGPFIARPAAGGYEAHYPPPEDGRWTVVIEVRSALGDATARHPYRAPAGGIWTGRAALVINGLVVVVLVTAVFLLPRLGRRPRSAVAGQGDRAATIPD
jgi:hypothetical protein